MKSICFGDLYYSSIALSIGNVKKQQKCQGSQKLPPLTLSPRLSEDRSEDIMERQKAILDSREIFDFETHNLEKESRLFNKVAIQNTLDWCLPEEMKSLKLASETRDFKMRDTYTHFTTLLYPSSSINFVDESVSRMVKLEELDLSDNLLHHLPLHPSLSLKRLHLYNNQIMTPFIQDEEESVDEFGGKGRGSHLPYLWPSLLFLGIGYNLLRSIDLTPFPSLISLDLSYNSLSAIRPLCMGLSVAKLTLRQLVLEGNPVTISKCYRVFVCSALPRLITLDDLEVEEWEREIDSDELEKGALALQVWQDMFFSKKREEIALNTQDVQEMLMVQAARKIQNAYRRRLAIIKAKKRQKIREGQMKEGIVTFGVAVLSCGMRSEGRRLVHTIKQMNGEERKSAQTMEESGDEPTPQLRIESSFTLEEGGGDYIKYSCTTGLKELGEKMEFGEEDGCVGSFKVPISPNLRDAMVMKGIQLAIIFDTRDGENKEDEEESEVWRGYLNLEGMFDSELIKNSKGSPSTHMSVPYRFILKKDSENKDQIELEEGEEVVKSEETEMKEGMIEIGVILNESAQRFLASNQDG